MHSGGFSFGGGFGTGELVAIVLYCSISDVRALGFSEDEYSDDQIRAAILRSVDSIDRYCANFFTPRHMTVRAELGGRGVAVVPLTLQSVESVMFEATRTEIAASSYRVHSSRILGDFDGIQFAVAGFDDTISGAERENGGFSTLFAPGRALWIQGVFGKETIPHRVATQSAILTSEDLSGTLDVDSEGVQSEMTPGWRRIWTAGAGMTRTTGSARVDRALREYRRDAVRYVGI